jgi:type I restriction enzyme M protein
MNRSVWPLQAVSPGRNAATGCSSGLLKEFGFLVHPYQKITSTYHAWRGVASTKKKEPGTKAPKAAYADVAGFCKSATTDDIASHGHVLTPGRYVGAEEVEDDGDPFEEKMPRLVAELNAQFAESAKLEKLIMKNLQGLGYGRGEK